METTDKTAQRSQSADDKWKWWVQKRNKLLLQRKLMEKQPFTVEEIEYICMCSKKGFSAQSPLIEPQPPLNICGDLHGQFHDLLRLLNYGGYPPKTRYLFLGDYVDRGPMSLETVTLLLLYKIRYPDDVILLRGNHEFENLNSVYGFKAEILRRYGDEHLWNKFNETFNWMPLAALIKKRIFCMHGGISMYLTNWNQIRTLPRPMPFPVDPVSTDLLWADPVHNQKGWRGSVRGISYGFGEDAVYKFCRYMDIDMIVRAHQVVQNGYEFFAANHLITVFSAPNYCGVFDNDAGMVVVNRKLKCTVKQFRPPKPMPKRSISRSSS
uniref:Serine/threonine-protein phosphatase n=1 Tax=Trichuris muris TaxID=70415 RepID=A0A5S6QR47_TRIMR